MKITLTSDFHGTSVTLNADVRSHVHNVSTAYLTENQVRKAKRELCGTAGCSCSGTVGTRGRQQTPSGKRLEVNFDSVIEQRMTGK